MFTLFDNVMSYLNRKLIITDNESNAPYLIRYYLLLKNRKKFPINITLHKILRSDQDDLHDHPWHYATFILKGGYYEHTLTGTYWRGPGHFRFRKSTSFHKLVLKKDASGNEIPCWSLFIMFKRTRKWGFLHNKEWIESTQYFNLISKSVYAIQIPFDKDDWMFVTNRNNTRQNLDRLRVTYKTYKEAKDNAKIWNHHRIVRIKGNPQESNNYHTMAKSTNT